MTIDLSVTLGRLRLDTPVMIAAIPDGRPSVGPGVAALVTKTVTRHPRDGNPPPWRAGDLNAIGLANAGLDAFLKDELPALAALPTALVVSLAGTPDELAEMAAALGGTPGVAAIELNLSCPNVEGGAAVPWLVARSVQAVREACGLPVLAKLGTADGRLAEAALAAARADALVVGNSVPGMAIDWRRRRPSLGGITGGLGGRAIFPLALLAVWRVAALTRTPVVGCGGVCSVDDAMQMLAAGASAVQMGSANLVSPLASRRAAAALPDALAEAGATSVTSFVGCARGEGVRP